MSCVLTVDIIINNYNYGRFVEACVDSALGQTYGRVRVIVVDDGSTDDSRQRLCDYANRVDLVFKQNGGQASAINAGFLRSRGDVVIFLDADDVLHSAAAELVAAAFAEHSAAARVQYRQDVIDDEGRPTGVVQPEAHLRMLSGDLRRAELVCPLDLVWLRSGAVAFRSTALRRVLPIPEREFAACPDWYLVHLTTLVGDVVSLPDVATSYRIHGDNHYAIGEQRLDLRHVRQSIAYGAATTKALERFSDELGLERPHSEILSVSDVANRLVSLRLDPGAHPVDGDRRWSLPVLGIRAATRRVDVAVGMKLLFGAWFVAMSIVPRRLAIPLAERFIFPERRRLLNTLLARWHRGQVG